MTEQEARAAVREYLNGKTAVEANKWCDMRVDEGGWLAVAKSIGLDRPTQPQEA